MKRLFIISEPRSGSTWLMQTLRSHSEIDLLSEIYNHKLYKEAEGFHEVPDEEFHECIEYLELKLSILNNKYTGCKILMDQLNRFNSNFPSFFIEYFKDAFFLILTRQNMLECQVSLCIAHTYNTWHIDNKNDLALRKVKIDLPHLIENLENFNVIRNSLLKDLYNFDAKFLHISYENLFTDTERILNNICCFLNLSNKFKYSNEIKGNPYKIREVIENYEETKDFLRDFPLYFKMLDE